MVLEYAQVEVDCCADCGGIWLDAGELELLLGDRALAEGFLNAGVATDAVKEKARRCPICRTRMDKQSAPGAAPVVFDHCPAAHGLWFDRGELALLLDQGAAGPAGGEVVAWLRELFAGQADAAK
jgi:Zn-finger nucleic acid-binding protein